MGPMGEALVPFSALNDAQVYVKDHGGKILRFDEITMDMLRPIKEDHPPSEMGELKNSNFLIFEKLMIENNT